MSSNSSLQNSQKLVEGFGASFFHWVATEVLPYALGSVLAVCVLVGIILNIIFLVVFVKRRLYNDPTNDFIPQIAIVDLIASFVVIIPSSVTAIMHEWPLSDTLCHVHGILVTWFHLLSFGLVVIVFVERVVKTWNTQLHRVTFDRHIFVVVISVTVWAAHLLVALLPVLGFGSIEFHKYESQCSLPSKHELQKHIIFALGIYSSPLICFICFFLIFEKRRRNIAQEKTEEHNKLIDMKDAESRIEGEAGKGVEAGDGKGAAGKPGEGGNKDGGKGGEAPTVVTNGPGKAWTKPSENGKTPMFDKNPKNAAKGKDKAKGPCAKKTKREGFLEEYNRRMSRPVSGNFMRKLFRDTEEEKDHHQAMTALIMWSVLEFCWIWTVVAAVLELYSGTDVWGGWHTIGVLLGDMTYCIKPIVYLAHNRHYRQASKETMPESSGKRRML